MLYVHDLALVSFKTSHSIKILTIQSINGQWNHDLFQARRSGGGQAGVRPESAKLVISNLDFGVNDQDIKVCPFF